MSSYCKLKQHNNVNNKYGTMLDLVLSNFRIEQVEVNGDVEPVVPADAYHPPLSVCVRGARPVRRQVDPSRVVDSDLSANNVLPVWNFRKADFQALYANLAAVEWDDMYLRNEVDSSVSVFYDILNTCVDMHVPTRRTKHSNSLFQYPTWFNSDIINYIKLKYYNLKKFKEFGLEYNKEMFKYFRSRVKEMIDIAYSNYLKQTERDIKNNPKQFWKFINDQKSTKDNLSEFEYKDQMVSGFDAANSFADYFKSVFTNSQPPPMASGAEHNATSALCSSRVSVDSVCTRDVTVAVRRLKAHSAAGPDGIPPFLVKDCMNIFERPLLYIFNLSLKTATYPSVWKLSRVTPIPKDGSRTKVENYRPIAVLSAFGKLFESILNRHITAQINTQLCDAQHGFRAGRSTATNHVNFVDYAVTEMDRTKQVDVAYFDFRKAFDRVNNEILLKKFSNIGFTPKLQNLFTSYFSDRYQYVQLLGYNSYSYLTCSGVSQGSTLGPTQFLIMINDLPNVVRSAKCLMFADDLKLFLGIGDTGDCDALQRDIDNVVEWSERNQLEFNTSKCKTVTFTRSRAPILYPYNICNVPLERVTRIRDLGLTLDTELTFNQHITEMCSQARKSLGFVLRQAAKFCDKSTIVTLYSAFVRSRLEYNSIIWDPHEAKYKLMVEKVQKKFNRFLYKKLFGYYPDFTYPSLFVAGMVGINTLEFRRKCAIMIHYYLLLHNRIDNPSTVSRCSLIVPERCRRAHVRRLLAAPPARTATSQYAPTRQAVDLLNSLTARYPEVDIFHMPLGTFVKYCVIYLSNYSV